MLNIVLYYSQSLKSCKCLIFCIDQWNCNQLKTIHISTSRYFSRLSNTKFIRYTFDTKLSWKVNIFIVGIKHKDFFFLKKQVIIIHILTEAQGTFILTNFPVNQSFHYFQKLHLHLAVENYSWDCQHVMMKYYQHQNLQHFLNAKTKTIKCYCVATIHIIFPVTIIYYTSCFK